MTADYDEVISHRPSRSCASLTSTQVLLTTTTPSPPIRTILFTWAPRWPSRPCYRPLSVGIICLRAALSLAILRINRVIHMPRWGLVVSRLV